MHSLDSNEASSPYVQQVARKFVSLYYRVLNHYAGYLFHFYSSDSTVVVCEVKEDGQPLTTKAENGETVRALLRTMYDEVTIVVRNCTPQSSSGGCISVLVTGIMSHKPGVEDRAFTQAFILRRQCDGYYVKTDTVLVFPSVPSASSSLLAFSSPLTEPLSECADEATVAFGQYFPQTVQPRMEIAPYAPVQLIDRGPVYATNGLTTTNPALETQQSFAFDLGASGGMPAREQQLSSTDADTKNRQGCQMVSGMRNGYTRKGGSSGSAPGALFAPRVAEDLAPDMSHFCIQPFSHRSSPRVPVVETKQPPPNEFDDRFLFTCKLPQGISAEEVTQVFSQYGKLSDDEPVRVFSGPNQGYARVCYVNAEDCQKAIDAQICIGEHEIVTEQWRPRERPRGRRRRQDSAAEAGAVVPAN